MGPWIKLLLSFAAGAVVGGLASGLLALRYCDSRFADSYALGVADQANVAREIYAGRSSQLAARIVDAMPQYVLALDREFSGAHWTQPALWLVQDVYEEGGIEVPSEIRHVLAALPPKPPGGCELPARSTR